ncbi:luciferase family protein [Mycolicibacterium conceptionense]|uniref:Luciferase family protein n=1 Tax=Mycolicibacterium conceptionense TaxID=451644 RepID=A0A0U1DZZ0_9MYCO|nr:luciferase family protein [Mycolicibacterium conceptionense]
MRIGVVFPQTELGGDPGAVRAYGQRVEELGFTHILAYDHVVGADPAVHRDWSGPYDLYTTFHEPMVMFGYLAAVTSLELVTGVIILPQRQAVLVAKQAAEVDLLTGGRLRLGVGLGWNAVEYEALGEDFGNRGKRSEEQVELMRRLWTESSVTFEGRYHRVTGAGLAPLPCSDHRCGSEGHLPGAGPGGHGDGAGPGPVERAAVSADRDPASIGMEGRVHWTGDPDQAATDIAAWAKAGATHVTVNTMGAGLRTVDEHLAALQSVARTQ